MDSSEKAEDSPLQNSPSSSLPPASALAWGLGKGEASTTLPPPSRGQRRDPSDLKIIWKVEPIHPTTRVHSKQTGLVVMAPWWRLAQRPFCPSRHPDEEDTACNHPCSSRSGEAPEWQDLNQILSPVRPAQEWRREQGLPWPCLWRVFTGHPRDLAARSALSWFPGA